MKDFSIRLGASLFNPRDRSGTFNPGSMPEGDHVGYYATQFNTLELDCTSHQIPSVRTVRDWYSKTPADFLFTAKVPRKITREKVLMDCEDDLTNFLNVMDKLGEKLGPLLLQFGYFSKKVFSGVNEFLARLAPFLAKLPRGYRFAVEIRNRSWLVPQFVETLGERGVALALIDQMGMPRPADWFEKINPLSSDFTYVRWVGNGKGMEEWAKVWSHAMIDRRRHLLEWVRVLKGVHRRGTQIIAFANHHYAGDASRTIEAFWNLWEATDQGARLHPRSETERSQEEL